MYHLSIKRLFALHSNAACPPNLWKNHMLHCLYCTRTSTGQGCYRHTAVSELQPEANTLPYFTCCIYTDSVQLSRLLHKTDFQRNLQKKVECKNIKKTLVFQILSKDNLKYLCNICLPISKIRVAVIPAIGLF